MKKLLGLIIVATFLVIVANNAQAISKVALTYVSVSLTGNSASQTTANPTAVAVQGEEGSKHCERPDPNNPDVGRNDPNKIGCGCEYKCVNGKPDEDNSDPAHRCKNHCKKDQCDCTKPVCKS